jgi:NhaP-type Na+/H+ or K+/H+ antiporter
MLGLALVLFSDAVTVDLRKVRQQRPLIWRLLGPGTLIPAAIVAIAARFLLDASWPAAFILGAALASTDPVLLRSAFRSGAMPETSRTALRIGSGMNDVVLLPIVVLAILALSDSSAAPAEANSNVARSVVGLFLLGPALGALVGWLGIVVLEQIRAKVGVRRDYESLYALGLAFSAFALAESVGGSGFLAAFAAGLMVSSQDVELCDCFLEYGEATAEMLLLLTFVALGTSLIWTGLAVFGFRTFVFTVIALVARTVVLYPVLKHTHTNMRERRIIALFGPRGLSSLLLVLLPVFAGIQGAEQLFMVTSLVVLCSILLHGGGITIFLRRNRNSPLPPADAVQLDRAPVGSPITAGKSTRSPLPVAEQAATESDKITIDEMLGLKERGEEVIVVDARADRSLRSDDLKAAGSVRIDPDHPVRDAKALRLSQNATLVLYCA